MVEHISLYYREGSSDKVYQISIEEKDGGYVVNFAYGRRGSTLATGSKTPSPVSIDQAKKVFDSLVKQKRAKGYKLSEEPGNNRYTDVDQVTTGIHCQLLNPIEEHEVDDFLNDDDYVAQEKHDGKRMLLMKRGVSLTAINRRGLSVGFPEVFNSLLASVEDFIIDGECVKEVFRAFDILGIGNVDLRSEPYIKRLTSLGTLTTALKSPSVVYPDTAFTRKEKIDLFNSLSKARAEGIVFKRKDASYTSGKPSSGGSQIKFKFYRTSSFIVSKVNGNKRSVAVSLLDQEGIRPAGNVTIPRNAAIPSAGDVIEVRYLYAFRESGLIYQPVYVGIREDIQANECRTTQLKFKPETED